MLEVTKNPLPRKYSFRKATVGGFKQYHELEF